MRRRLLDLLRPYTPFLRWPFGLLFDRDIMTGPLFDHSFSGYRRMSRAVWQQKILGFNRRAPWPMSPTTTISNYRRLKFDPSDINNLDSPGCYFQNFSADIVIGRGTYIGPNVGIITANHDPTDLAVHIPGSPVTLGVSCWVGMNSIILPGVVLGPRTIVGAGSVVTRSFPEGHCVIAGNPARVLRKIP